MGAADTSAAPAFRCSGLTNDHGRGRGVFDADLTVSRGESGAVGPDGSGRATTIPLLMDLIRSNRGTASVVGAYGQAYLAFPRSRRPGPPGRPDRYRWGGRPAPDGAQSQGGRSARATPTPLA